MRIHYYYNHYTWTELLGKSSKSCVNFKSFIIKSSFASLKSAKLSKMIAISCVLAKIVVRKFVNQVMLCLQSINDGKNNKNFQRIDANSRTKLFHFVIQDSNIQSFIVNFPFPYLIELIEPFFVQLILSKQMCISDQLNGSVSK